MGPKYNAGTSKFGSTKMYRRSKCASKRVKVPIESGPDSQSDLHDGGSTSIYSTRHFIGPKYNVASSSEEIVP